MFEIPYFKDYNVGHYYIVFIIFIGDSDYRKKPGESIMHRKQGMVAQLSVHLKIDACCQGKKVEILLSLWYFDYQVMKIFV